jgi:hypothetical protein
LSAPSESKPLKRKSGFVAIFIQQSLQAVTLKRDVINSRDSIVNEDIGKLPDISQDQMAVNLYKKNEQYDGYIRDGCVYRHAGKFW